MGRRSNEKESYFIKSDLLERGWTHALIARFLDPADQEIQNRSYRGGAPVKLYRKDRVLAMEQETAARGALQKSEQQRTRGQVRRQRERERDFSQFKEYFPRARALERRFVYFCGPTNSGKTFHALNALCEHSSGAYLAPLRLLALEGQEEIEKRGKLCSLITGDEREIKLEARFRSQTIESFNYEEEVDAVLIDEVQMLVDEQRGEHWVSALIGAPATTIYLAGSTEAISYIQQICQYVGSPLEVHMMERLSPLHVDTRTRSLEEALAGRGQKAFVVFSRQGIFDLKDAIEEQGQHAAAVIYGSLGPAVRRKEAERFRSGECSVLIATDAIGMGLNLPIDQLYFVATRKFDGVQERELTPTELRQIGGRAGRYKKSKSGLVGAVFQADLDSISSALERRPTRFAVKPLRLGLSLPLAHELAQLRKTSSLAKVMQFFSGMKDSSGLFQPQVQPQAVRLAALLDTYRSLSFDLKYRLAFAPVDTDDTWLFEEYRYQVDQLAAGRPLDFGDVGPYDLSSLTLIETERLVKLYTLRLWLAFQYSDPEDILRLEEERDAANTAIENFLRAKARHQRRRCRMCERELPRFSSYGICQSCFNKSKLRRRRY